MSLGSYNCQVTIVGDLVKVRRYGRRIYLGGKNQQTTRAQRLAETQATRVPKPRHLTLSEREGFKNLMDMNFITGHQYITLTYGKEDVTLEEASHHFGNWIKRMRERYGDFRYLGVRSFQKRSTPHFHLLTDLPHIPADELKDGAFQRIWGHGIVHVKRIYHMPIGTGRNKLQQYLLKNLAEFKADERSYGKRLYLRSKNLIEPKTVKGDYKTLKADFISSGHTLKLVESRRFDVEYLNYIELNTYRVIQKNFLRKVKPMEKCQDTSYPQSLLRLLGGDDCIETSKYG